MEEKKERKKKKIKPKKKTIIITVILLIVLAIISNLTYRYMDKQIQMKIKKNYNEFVATNKEAKIYNSKHKKIGTISNSLYLELEKKETPKDKYYKVKNTNYYVKYTDIKKAKQQKEEEQEKNYLTMNKNITSNKEQILYNGKEKVITVKEMNLPIEYMDKDNYYVNLFNNILSVKKNNTIKEQKSNNTKENKTEKVSVIHYEKIDDNCGDDVCLKQASVIAHIKKLTKEGYYLLTKNEYLEYINGYKDFKPKAIFMTTNEINDNVKNINNTLKVEIANIDEKDGINFETTNKPSTLKDDKKHINRYQAKKYTLIDDYSVMASGEEFQDTGKKSSDNQAIPVVNYHFFTNKEKGIICIPYESICLEENLFRSHLDYLKENGYKTLTIHEFADWMDGIIEIPDKSILITVDDGGKGTGKHNGDLLNPILEEYKMHATLFLIAGWWDIANYQSDYLDIQSHTFDMHGGASNRKILNLGKEDIKEDIKKSLDIINDNTTFCYPFYEYDNKSIQSLQELGVKYAFAGGSRHARRSDNHYIIPRYPIVGDVSKQAFANMIN